MKKIWIILIAMIVLLAINVSALHNISDIDSAGTNWDGTSPSDADAISTGGWTNEEGGDSCDYIQSVGNDWDGDDFYIGCPDGGAPGYSYQNASVGTVYLTVMFYDDTADAVGNFHTGVGWQDFGAGVRTGIDGVNYVVQKPTWSSSGIARSTGWHNFTWYLNHSNSNFHFYIDGTFIANWTTVFTEINRVYVLDAESGSNNLLYWDYIHFWNLTEDPAPPPIILAPIIVNITYPVNNTNFSASTTSFEINVTHNETTGVTCTLNSTDYTQSGAVGDTVSFLNNTLIPQGSHTILASCNKTGTANGTAIGFFYVDLVIPQLLTNFTNSTIYYDRELKGWFNLSDDFSLYSYNVSIDGISKDYKNELNVQLYQLNFSYNIENLSVGQHTLDITYADGHTALYAKPADKITDGILNNYLKYDYGEEYIKISSGLFDTWSTKKEFDRYTFDYKPFSELNVYEIEVESDKEIYIMDMPNTNLKKWLVIGGHWVDFDTEAATDIQIERLSSNKVKVTISGQFKGKDILQFSSVGDINIVTNQYTFITTNASVSYSEVVQELESQTITMNINTTFGISSTNATLTYNGTNQVLTKTSLGNYDNYVATFTTPQLQHSDNLTFTLNATVVGNTTERIDLRFNQTVFGLLIDNCSTHKTVAINFTIKNETSDLEINGNIDGFFTGWINSISQSKNFNLSWGFGNNRAICISPPYAEYTIDAQIEYSAPGFTEKTYYFDDVNLNNISNEVILYLTDGTTPVTFNVKDQNDDDVQDVFISVLSYDLPTDTFKTTEIVKTDTNGNAIANIVLTTQWYKFILTLDGEVKLATTSMKILTTSQTFRINLLDDFFEGFDTVVETSCDITYTNSTGIFLLTYNDPSGNVNQACLNVIKRTVNGDTLINETCASSSSGSISSSVGAVSQNEYIATGTITLDGISNVCSIESVNFNNTYKMFGLTGIFVTFMLVLTLVMVGIWNPLVSVILMAFGVMLSIILKIFYLSAPIVVSFIIVSIITIYRLNRK